MFRLWKWHDTGYMPPKKREKKIKYNLVQENLSVEQNKVKCNTRKREVKFTSTRKGLMSPPTNN